MTQYAFVSVAVDGRGIATVELRRPPVNAVNQAMYREVRAVFDELGRTEGVKVASSQIGSRSGI